LGHGAAYKSAAEDTGMTLTLRPYQIEAIERARESFRRGMKRPILAIPPGGGKTVMSAFMAQQAQERGLTVWFIIHRRELYDQTIDTFDRFGIERRSIYVGMVGTIANHLDRYPAPDFIHYDECHHAICKTWQRITDAYPDAFYIGLSGSPARLDGRPLGGVFDNLIEVISTRELIDQGYLAPYRYFAPAVTDLSALKRRGSDYDTEQAAQLLSERAVFGDVIKHYREHADGLQAIAYCSTVAHSERTADAFNDAGIEAVSFDGTTPDAIRRGIISRFRNGDIKILCNCDLIGEGFDVPDCHVCILLRPTMSTGLFIQQSMRCMRPQPGKTAIILDHVNNYVRHGLPDDPREWSLTDTIKPRREYGADGLLTVRQCPMCYYTFKSGPPVCPNCGAPIQKTREEIKNVKDIKLAEIKQRRIETAREKVTDDTELSECRTLAEFQAYAKIRGYKSGWAYITWKRKIQGRATV
jgi:superfamily II DNA or RNA helicase